MLLDADHWPMGVAAWGPGGCMRHVPQVPAPCTLLLIPLHAPPAVGCRNRANMFTRKALLIVVFLAAAHCAAADTDGRRRELKQKASRLRNRCLQLFDARALRAGVLKQCTCCLLFCPLRPAPATQLPTCAPTCAGLRARCGQRAQGPVRPRLCYQAL